MVYSYTKKSSPKYINTRTNGFFICNDFYKYSRMVDNIKKELWTPLSVFQANRKVGDKSSYFSYWVYFPGHRDI